MSVFFTDTDCELWYTEVDKLGISNIFLMPYTLDGEEIFYDFGRNTDVNYIFERMKQGAIPITSSLNPAIYEEYITPIFEKGQDILYVHFSDNLSATFKHLDTALQGLKIKFPDRKMTLINTKSISIGAGALVRIAAEMHNKGMNDEEILNKMSTIIPRSRAIFLVDDIKYLKRGGRISSTTAAFGSLLNIKPLLHVTQDGKIEKCSTAIGKKKGIKELAKRVIEEADTNYIIDVTHANCKEEADELESLIKEKLSNIKINKIPTGPVIGCHSGPGTLGVSFISK